MHALLYKCPHCEAPVEFEPRDKDEVITCPRCDRPFEAKLPAAEPASGPLVATPDGPAFAEGNGNGTVAASPAAAPAAAEAPPAQAPVEEEVERTVVDVRPHMFRRYPGRYVGLIGLLVTGVAGLVIAITYSLWLLAVVAAVVLANAAYQFARWALRVRATRLTITNKRTIVQHGMFKRERVELQHEDLDTLKVYQTFWNRQFNTGDLAVTINSDGGKQQVFVMALPDPTGLAEVIRRQVQPAPPADATAQEMVAQPAGQA